MVGNFFTSAWQLLAGQMEPEHQVIGGIFTLFVCTAIGAVGWNRRQRAANKPGMSSLPFIIGCFAIALIAVGAGAYGIGLRSAPPTVDAGQPKDVVATHIDLGTPPNKSVLIANRYYSAKNKEDVADRLDRISGELNKTGNEISELAELAINHSPWERSGEDLRPYIDRMDQISNLRTKMAASLYDQLVDKERDYRVEINAILFPQEPINNLRIGVKAFRDGLFTWGKMRDIAEGDSKSALLELVQSSRIAFATSRNEFVAWMDKRREIIDQTRRALRQ